MSVAAGDRDRDNVVPMGRALPANGNGGGGPSHGERLARVEARLEALNDTIRMHGATRDDIPKVKTWFLGGVLAAIGLAIPTAAGVAYAVARLFSAP